jgi:hypothetical protein
MFKFNDHVEQISVITTDLTYNKLKFFILLES